MKRTILLLVATLMQAMAWADNGSLTLNAGVPIPLQSTGTVKAKDLTVGRFIPFMVACDVKVNGTTVIPYGTLVNGTVTKKKKSSPFGTKGRMEVEITELLTPRGEKVPLAGGKIYATGKNRTPVAVGVGILIWPMYFFPGTTAKIPEGYEVLTTVAQPVEVAVDAATLQQAATPTQGMPRERAEANSPEAPKRATVVTKDGTSLEVLVYAVDYEEVAYKKQSYPDGPLYKVPRSTISKITLQ